VHTPTLSVAENTDGQFVSKTRLNELYNYIPVQLFRIRLVTDGQTDTDMRRIVKVIVTSTARTVMRHASPLAHQIRHALRRHTALCRAAPRQIWCEKT